MTSVPIKARHLRAFLYPNEQISLYGLSDRLDFYQTAHPRELRFIGQITYALSENKLI